MPTRLVLEPTRADAVLLERLTERGSVLAVVPQDGGTDVGGPSVPTERADPTDPDALAALAEAPASVVVATRDPERAARSVAAARAAFPDAAVLALSAPVYEGGERPEAGRALAPDWAVAGRLLEYVAGDAAERALSLRAALVAAEEPIAVLMHDNPDPDAIASAVALSHVAESLGVDAEPCYFGAISHQENRAMVNLLELDLRQLSAPGDLADHGSVALVDHARPGVNDQLPPGTPVEVVIDHHPTHGPDDAAFVDLRSGVGATSTLLAEYLDRLGVAFTRTVATALLYGLRVDTDDFAREVAVADFEAAATLLPHADRSVLERVESPSLDAETLDVLARAIEGRRRTDGVLTTFVGEISNRDALAQAADRLLDLRGVSTTVVFGVLEGTVHVSARARGATIDLGETLRSAFDQLGSAGGHADMAGAQIPVGMLVEEADEEPMAIVEEVLTVALLEAMETSYAPPAGEYVGTGEFSFLRRPGRGEVVRVAGGGIDETAARLGDARRGKRADDG